jgi:cytochrome c oxidase cbb3-type subunit 3
MSDFDSGFWGYYIGAVTLVGIVYCLWLLFTQRAWLAKKVPKGEDLGHVWDGNLSELNHAVPRWWTVFYIGLCIFGFAYLALYPGLGSFAGVLKYSSAQEVRDRQAEHNALIQKTYAKYVGMEIPAIAADGDAREIGRKLFLNNCAQCHGSDAHGAANFPNLADADWLHGGDPEQIMLSITKGRIGVMPPWKDAIKPSEAADIAQFVRSLSGLAADPLRVLPGRRGFETYCVTCHGAEGKGNPELGAPNLSDATWLYGSSEASIVETILNGRNNEMPAQEQTLTSEQIRVLTAWVWGLSQQAKAAAAAK